VKFRSHGRNHTLNLKESRTDLSRLPIKLLGMSSDDEQIVKEKLKVINDFFLLKYSSPIVEKTLIAPSCF